jgi:hypothetical protein
VSKIKNKTVWILLILGIFFTALLIDEQPIREYLELTKTATVDNNAWLDFQDLASININAEAPRVKYQEFIDILQFKGTEKAKLFLADMKPYLKLDFDLSEYCSHTGNEKIEFYDCLDEYVKNRSIIKNEFEEHSLILERINKSEYIFDAKVDTQLMKQINLNAQTMLIPDLFRVNQVFKISHELVAIDKLYQVLRSQNSKKYCETIFIDVLENRYARVENSNNLLFAIDSLVKTKYLLDVAIYLTNNHPELSECLNALTIKESKGVLNGLHESIKQEFVGLTLAFDGAAEDTRSELPWYFMLFYKHQKTINYGSKKYSEILNDLLLVDSEFFSQKEDIEESSLLRHWNNISGYIMMNVASPGYVNLKADFAMLSAKFNLVILNARLKHCERLGDSDCDMILNDFKDPIWGLVPVLDKVEGTLSYIYTEKDKVTIPY